jgi:hypothetical protein
MNPSRFQKLQKADDSGAGGAGGAGAPPGGGGAGGGGAPAASWFGDAHKDYVSGKGFKSADDAIVSLQNAEKLIGAERAGRTLIRPKDDKDAEGLKAWRAGIGVPEKADDYKLPVPDGMDDSFAKAASAWFHEIGVSKGDGVKLAEKWNAHVAQVLKDTDAQLATESTKQLDGLKTEWGKDFDQNSEFARRFMRESGWDDAKVKRYEETFGTAAMLKDFHGLGKKLGEAGFVKGDGSGGGGMTKEQAKQRIGELQAQRTAGTLKQDEFLKEMDKLGPIAHAA